MLLEKELELQNKEYEILQLELDELEKDQDDDWSDIGQLEELSLNDVDDQIDKYNSELKSTLENISQNVIDLVKLPQDLTDENIQSSNPKLKVSMSQVACFAENAQGFLNKVSKTYGWKLDELKSKSSNSINNDIEKDDEKQLKSKHHIFITVHL